MTPPRGRTIPAALLALELGAAVAAAGELLGCEVGVSERVCLPAPLSPVALGCCLIAAALAFLLSLRAPGAETLERIARALTPLGLLALVPLRARVLGGTPSFAEIVLAPAVLGLAVARAAPLLPRPRRFRARGLLGVVLAASVLVAAGFAAHALALLDGLALGYSDVGDYAARLESTIRGSFLGMAPGRSPFFDHLNPGLALLAPPYALARGVLPGPAFLTVVQAVTLAAAGPLAFLVARRRLADPLAAAFAALALLAAPAFTHQNVDSSYGFHPVTFALPCFLGAALAFFAGRRVLAAALIVLAWSFEETVAVAAFGGGLGLFLTTRRSPSKGKEGLALAAASLVYFLLATRVVMPALNKDGYFFVRRFGHLGGGMGEILLSPVLRPGAFFGTLLDGSTFAFLGGLLAPFAFVPALRPRALVAAAPVLLFACLRDDPHVKSIALHYHATVFAWIFLALVEGIRVAPGVRGHRRTRRRAVALGVLASALASAVLYGDPPFGRARSPFPLRPDRAADIAAVASEVGGPGALAATNRLAAHLVTVHPDLKLVRGEAIPGVDAYALDFEDGFGATIPRLHRLARDLRRTGFGATLVRGSFLVLRAGAGRAPPATFGGPVPASPTLRLGETGLSLLSITQESGGRARLLWRVERATEADLGIAPLGPDGLVGEVGPIGPLDRPTYERAAGEVFLEERVLTAPPDGKLELRPFDYLELDRRGQEVIDVIR
jgi:uncharacterized membrane protein